WERIIAREGEIFHQVRGNRFTYRVVGNAIIPNRTPRQIPRSDFEKALALLPFRSTCDLQHLQDPSYLYALLMDPRIVPDGRSAARNTGGKIAPKAAPYQSPSARQAAPPPNSSSSTRSVPGYSFALVGALKPDRDVAGAVKKQMPQKRYAKASITPRN